MLPKKRPNTVWKNFVDSLMHGIPQSDKRFWGMKVSGVGFLIALAGILLLIAGLKEAGRMIAYLGAGVSVAGTITGILIKLFRND
ncbi:MAG: hypothetical protein ACLPXB_15985 [Thiobacillaceae bacterium]